MLRDSFSLFLRDEIIGLDVPKEGMFPFSLQN